MIADLSRFAQLAFSGRAILLSGQNLEPGTGELLRKKLLSGLQLDEKATLADACRIISEPAAIASASNSIVAGPTKGLRRVAEVPWAAVFTSAIDDLLSTELARQDSQGRRLRHLSVDERLPAFFPRHNDVLTIMHLMHSADRQTATGSPVCGTQWGRAQRLLIPGVLRGLPQSIGPAHILCIAGIDSSDPLSAIW